MNTRSAHLPSHSHSHSHVSCKSRKAGLTFLNNLQILILALHDPLQIFQVLRQVVAFTRVELQRVRRALLDVEACADVDYYRGGGGELSGNVEGLC